MVLNNFQQMQDLGAELYRLFDTGGVVFLKGNLGVGKTTLVRGFLHAAQITQSIRSPTYTLMEHYQTDKLKVIHMDLYRLSEPEELEYLAVREMLADDTLVFIEWPDKAEGFFREIDLEINIDYCDEGRDISFVAHNDMANKIIKDLESSYLNER